MSVFAIRYRNGDELEYRVTFSPWPTWQMLNALAETMLKEKGGVACEFRGPNGLHGFVKRKDVA